MAWLLVQAAALVTPQCSKRKYAFVTAKIENEIETPLRNRKL